MSKTKLYEAYIERMEGPQLLFAEALWEGDWYAIYS